MDSDFFKQVYNKACDYLARREHSVLELYKKLLRFFDKKDLPEETDAHATVSQVITQLQERNFVSNERYTDRFVSSKLKKGHGPLSIQKQLFAKGITNELWLDVWQNYAEQEPKLCEAALLKWLKSSRGRSLNLSQSVDKAKAARFLAGRGFFQHTIYETLARHGK